MRADGTHQLLVSSSQTDGWSRDIPSERKEEHPTELYSCNYKNIYAPVQQVRFLRGSTEATPQQLYPPTMMAKMNE